MSTCAIIERSELALLGVKEWQRGPFQAALPIPRNNQCVLVWDGERDAVPDAIVVADGDLSGFLSWSATYLPHLVPLTGLTDVIENSKFVRRRTARLNHNDKTVSRRAEVVRGWLGILHAEVVAAFDGAFAAPSYGLTPYISTLSWLYLQAALTGPRDEDAPDESLMLSKGWQEAREILDARRTTYSLADIDEIWSLLGPMSTSGRRNHERDQVRSFLASVADGAPAFDVLGVATDLIDQVRALDRGPLEGRVDVFKAMLRGFSQSRSGRAVDSVLVGFALSQISQGSFRHVSLVSPARLSDVRPLLWYGWFDFSRHRPEVGSAPVALASQHLLRSVAYRDERARPNISIDELKVISRLRESYENCLLDFRHPIYVEISPGLACMIQPGSRAGRAPRQQRLRQTSLFD